jgi:senataxin
MVRPCSSKLSPSAFRTHLSCFALLLSLSPTHHIWSFDPSPELPHTLFSDIKNNPAFHALLLDLYKASPNSIPSLPHITTDTYDKGKRKQDVKAEPLLWIVDFLLSTAEVEAGASARMANDHGFGEALANVMTFCFVQMQHGRFTGDLRAAAAHTGFKVSFSPYKLIVRHLQLCKTPYRP